MQACLLLFAHTETHRQRHTDTATHAPPPSYLTRGVDGLARRQAAGKTEPAPSQPPCGFQALCVHSSAAGNSSSQAASQQRQMKRCVNNTATKEKQKQTSAQAHQPSQKKEKRQTHKERETHTHTHTRKKQQTANLEKPGHEHWCHVLNCVCI